MAVWANGLRPAGLRLDPVRVDELLGLAVLAEIELYVWLSGSSPARFFPTVAGVALGAGVAFRRRWPLGVALVVVCALVVEMALGDTAGTAAALQGSVGAPVALLLLFYGVGAFADEWRSLLVLVLAVAVTSVHTVRTPGKTVGDAVVMAASFAVAYALGRGVRGQAGRVRTLRAQVEDLDAAAQRSASQATQAERVRIARELHDAITHSVSVMVIHAGGARRIMATDPKRAEASLRNVERAGQEALAEIRRLVGVLDQEVGARPHVPQPNLSNLGELLTAARAAGLTVQLRVAGEPVAVTPALELCVYRVVQEALTNTIKHALPARADVHIQWAREAIDIKVSDDGRPSMSNRNSAADGHGLLGMRERVAIHGGRLQAGHGREGGFIVRACLPFDPDTSR